MTATTIEAPAPAYTHPLDHTEVWFPGRHVAEGTPIDDMGPVQRLAVAVMLLDTAPVRAAAYQEYAVWDGQPRPTILDPTGWMTTTPLFHALIAGLSAKRSRLAALAERARHEATCTGQPCICEPLPPAGRAHLATIGAAILATRTGGTQ